MEKGTCCTILMVGDGRRFKAEDATLTDPSSQDVCRAGDEANWHRLPLLTALTALAALMHDLGKATLAFQERLLEAGASERNHYRHEWVSVRLFQAFVGQEDDSAWLRRLADGALNDHDDAAFEDLWLDHGGGRLLRDGLDTDEEKDGPLGANNPFRALPPLAQALAWLVLTHHRLPCKPVRSDHDAGKDGRLRMRPFGARPRFINPDDLDGLLAQVYADWNEPRERRMRAEIETYWHFPHGLPVHGPAWRKQAAHYAKKLLILSDAGSTSSVLDDPFVMHVSRMCLMLADHHYSRHGLDEQNQPVAARRLYLQPEAKLAANTTYTQERRSVLNQTLDEHLLGVQAHATLITRSLPTLATSLPALQNHRGLKKRSTQASFQWQNKATDLATAVRQRSVSQGAFIVNMASTGCGKTLGNARIMNALANPAIGMRCAFAIGLRTLTLQTGRVFQKDLGLNDEQLAIRVGGASSRALLEYWERQAEATGSASRQSLLDEGGQVLFEGDDRHPLLERLSDDAQVRSLLAAPLLACTVDHLMPATESLRGGRQIAPMLRLMTGDLVLDEPDDFDMADLPALVRLVHWAGLLGTRVLLSSATLPPALVEGLFQAYCVGRAIFQCNRGERPTEPVNICCLWVDEFHQAAQDCPDASGFRDAHAAFVEKRAAKLAQAEVRRLARIAELPPTWHAMERFERRTDFARFVLDRAWQLHQLEQNHMVDPISGKRLSLGLIRMANIAPLFDVALAMYRQGAPAPGVRVHLCVYHSQFPLLARSAIEAQLDTVLNRRASVDTADPLPRHPAIRAQLDVFPEAHHMFIVLGSPVTEVGRDHDYDWAIVEPSSMRSLIQLAGRVRRHRSGSAKELNLLVLDSNLRALERPGDAAFCQPGFEMHASASERRADGKWNSSAQFHLTSHLLQKSLPELSATDAMPLDARPRIAPRNSLKPQERMVDLEHGRMRDSLLPRGEGSHFFTPIARDATLHWAHPGNLWLTGLLPQFQRFRYDPLPREEVALLPLDDGEAELHLHRVAKGAQPGEPLFVDINDLLHTLADRDLAGPGISPWCHAELLDVLASWAENRDESLRESAEKVATVSLPESREGWRFHSVLGFNKD
ncbi:MAG: type I-F CRISPR-associated helicase Cas3 [Variovorax sp.]|nr:type I-F CRISPR-associated helicase Cas3 [Variovorax sp.]